MPHLRRRAGGYWEGSQGGTETVMFKQSHMNGLGVPEDTTQDRNIGACFTQCTMLFMSSKHVFFIVVTLQTLQRPPSLNFNR